MGHRFLLSYADIHWRNVSPFVFPQLAVCTGKHSLAAAPVRHAKSGHAGVLGGGEGRKACPGALLRWLGPHPADRSPCQGSAGPLLPDIRGGDLKKTVWIVPLRLTCV